MIQAKDAIAAARALIGTPYSDMDCINLIKKVIRTSPGGSPGYTTAGTNTLWKSYEASEKYRDLTWRQEGIAGARSGMLVFQRNGTDVHHVGLVTGEGTVIHSSSAQGGRGVVETPLKEGGAWNLLAIHRHIGTQNAEEESDMEAYRAHVKLNNPDSWLNVRNEPGPGGDIIGKLSDGAAVTVQAEYENGWLFIAYGDSGVGYVSGDYVQKADTAGETAQEAGTQAYTTLQSEDGTTFMLLGRWHVAED